MTHQIHKYIFSILIFSFIAMSVHGQMRALRFHKMIDGYGNVTEKPIIVINGNKIQELGTEGKIVLPKNIAFTDLSEYTALPGLVDVHTHLSFAWDQLPGTTPWASLERMSNPHVFYYSVQNAFKTLESGVTTVRDLGSYEKLDADLKALIERGEVKGPRMFIAGNGLHVSLDPYLYLNFKDLGKADGVDEVIRVVRQQINSGVDWIKMYGSTGSDQDVTGFQTYTFDEMKAACDMAHFYKKGIAIHAYGGDAAKSAILAGANSIEHATDLDDEAIGEMVKRGTFYVPTVDHNRYYIEHASEFGYDSSIIRNLENFISRNLATLKKAIQANVKIAMGSDAVFTGFGQNARELEWFVKVGMTVQQAIYAATMSGAELLGKQNELGNISPGFYADIIAVKGDPYKNIQTLTRDVKWVMKNGEVVVDKR